MLDRASLTFTADRIAIAFSDGRPGVVLVAGRKVPRTQPRPGARTRYSVTGEHVAACVAACLDVLAGVERVAVELAPLPPADAPDRLAVLRARWLAVALLDALGERAELVEPPPPCRACDRPVLGFVPPGDPLCSRACARALAARDPVPRPRPGNGSPARRRTRSAP